MRTLLLNAPNIPFTDRDILMPQIDLLQEAGLLESLGHDAIFYDMDIERASDYDLEKKLVEDSIDVVYMLFDEVVQIHSHQAVRNAMNLGRLIRDTGRKVIFGGTVPSFFHNFILEKGYADVVLVGPPGPALRELFSNWNYRDNKRIAYKNSRGEVVGRDIYSRSLLEGFTLDDSYGIASRHLVNEENYPIDVRTIASSRGCRPNGKGCTFCPYSSFWGRYRHFSTELVLSDIEQIIEKGHRKIMFLDSSFTYSPFYTKDLFQKIIERGYNKYAIFGGMSRVDIDLDMLDLLQEGGLRFIHFGIESGDQETINKLRKSITVEQIEKAFYESKKRGLRTRGSIIIDSGDTKESVDKTIDLLCRISPNEIKPHFLSPRIYSDMQDITWENQSIFGSGSVVSKSISEYATRGLDQLADFFKAQGYLILLDSFAKEGFWKGLWERGEKGEEINFMSVAPARYGISW
ncbi:radical SAM protein [archaeon]|jgi:radical SAM superfamily enzyme YgiQ (UPF0313 family)|nr:radical SAM protein [archaeon]MBT4397332.1 radical SAM protein [archaeon]MBT4440712.1 radical SAM protein [archaeon]